MPWKPTRLTFCGIAVRRRTLYILTLFFAIAAVPTLSWAVLVDGTNASSNEKHAYMAAAAVVTFLAFIGWWTIIRHNCAIYQHEARFIWPGAAVLLALVIWLGVQVAQSIKPGQVSFIGPMALGGVFMVFLIARSFMLGRHPKRGDIVRGGPSRRSSRSPTPQGATPVENAAEDGLDEELVEDEAAPTDSAQ